MTWVSADELPAHACPLESAVEDRSHFPTELDLRRPGLAVGGCAGFCCRRG